MWIIESTGPITCEKDGDSLLARIVKAHLVEGKFSVGRKQCQILILEKSVSRKHATLSVTADTFSPREANTRQTLHIEDLGSKYGTYVNLRRIPPQQQIEVQDGDLLSFGMETAPLVGTRPTQAEVEAFLRTQGKKQTGPKSAGFHFRVRWWGVQLVLSRVTQKERGKLTADARKAGAYVSKVWGPSATHLVMDGTLSATVKALEALLDEKPIVTPQWLRKVLERPTVAAPLPASEECMPPEEGGPSGFFKPNRKRAGVFRSCGVLLFCPSQLEDLIRRAGGDIIKLSDELPEAEPDVSVLSSRIDAIVAKNRRSFCLQPPEPLLQKDKVLKSIYDAVSARRDVDVCTDHDVAARILCVDTACTEEQLEAEVDIDHRATSIEEDRITQSQERGEEGAVDIQSHPVAGASIKSADPGGLPRTNSQEERSVDVVDYMVREVPSEEEHIFSRVDDFSGWMQPRNKQKSTENRGAEGQHGAQKGEATSLPTVNEREEARRTDVDPTDDDVIEVEPAPVSTAPLLRSKETVEDISDTFIGQRNYKTFRKTPFVRADADRKRFRMVEELPPETERKRQLEREQQALEEEERLAEELFTMGERRPRKKITLRDFRAR